MTLSTPDLAPRQLVSFLTTASMLHLLEMQKTWSPWRIQCRWELRAENWMSAIICGATEVSEKTVLSICLQSLWPEDHLSDSVMCFDFHVYEFLFFLSFSLPQLKLSFRPSPVHDHQKAAKRISRGTVEFLWSLENLFLGGFQGLIFFQLDKVADQSMKSFPCFSQFKKISLLLYAVFHEIKRWPKKRLLVITSNLFFLVWTSCKNVLEKYSSFIFSYTTTHKTKENGVLGGVLLKAVKLGNH